MTYEVDERGCHVWQGKFDNGYPIQWVGGKAHKAYRLAYVEAYGEPPDGYQIDHTCRVRACVNPLHLEAVTAKENTRRRDWRYRVKKVTRCKNGHDLKRWSTRTVPEGGYICRRCVG